MAATLNNDEIGYLHVENKKLTVEEANMVGRFSSVWKIQEAQKVVCVGGH